MSITEKRKCICDSALTKTINIFLTLRKSHFNESLRTVSFAKKSFVHRQGKYLCVCFSANKLVRYDMNDHELEVQLPKGRDLENA